MRSKRLQLNPNLSDTGATKSWDANIEHGYKVMSQGIVPRGTTNKDLRQAEQISQATGTAYDAGKPMFDVTTS